MAGIGSEIITRSKLIDWTLSGHAFAAAYAGATATNGNLLVCGISIFNPPFSQKLMLIYSLSILVTGSTAPYVYLDTESTNPSGTTGFTNILSPYPLLIGSGSASLASVCASLSGISASVTPPGPYIQLSLMPASTSVELLSNSSVIALAPGRGIAVLTEVPTAGSAYATSAKWVEL